jgi:DnaJ-class molecular chaperone
MKKPIVNQPERNCPECMGTGFTMADHLTRLSVKIYQQCKECKGKGHVAVLLRRPRQGNIR